MEVSNGRDVMGVNHQGPIVTDGLVLCLDTANPKSYPGTGNTWIDLSGNGNNGTLTNAPTYNANNRGSLVFNGSNNTVDCGPVSQIGSALTGLTVSVWLKTSVSAIKCILENGTAYTTNTFYLFQENASNFSFEVYGTGYDAVFSSYTYQLNVWYNLIGVWRSGNRVDMYTNGILTNGTRGGSTQNSVKNGNTNLFIGARSGTSYNFSGNISNVQIYNRALSESEIQQNFNASRGRYGI